MGKDGINHKGTPVSDFFSLRLLPRDYSEELHPVLKCPPPTLEVPLLCDIELLGVVRRKKKIFRKTQEEQGLPGK